MKFKVGDTVRGVKNRSEFQHGKILGRVGVVKEADPESIDGMTCCVEFESYGSMVEYWLSEDQLELVSGENE